MKSEELKKLEAKRDHLREWVSRHKNAHDVLPYVQNNLELTEWEIQALTNPPKEANNICMPGLAGAINRDYDYVLGALPMMPEYDPNLLACSTAVSTSGTSNVCEYVIKIGDLGTQEAQTYSNKHVSLYQNLQEKQQRPKEVRALLEKLRSTQTLQRFDRALKTYTNTKVGTGDRTQAASEIRNMLCGIEGNLFELARKWTNENMTWDIMIQRLAKRGTAGAEYKTLCNYIPTHSELIDHLSCIAKDREGISPRNLDTVWAQVMNHIYTVLSLVNLPSM